MNKSELKGKDVRVNISMAEKALIDKEKVKKLLKRSPDTQKMFSVEVPAKRITYFCHTRTKQKQKIRELENEFIGFELIIKNPVK